MRAWEHMVLPELSSGGGAGPALSLSKGHGPMGINVSLPAGVRGRRSREPTFRNADCGSPVTKWAWENPVLPELSNYVDLGEPGSPRSP
jgi:hypothetical protein